MLHHNYVSINANRILAVKTDLFIVTDYLRVIYMTVIYSSIHQSLFFNPKIIIGEIIVS